MSSKKSEEQIIETFVASGSQDSGDIQKTLLRIMLEKYQREKAEEEERQKLLLEARKQGAMTMEMRRQAELAAQEACSHMKPYGGPAIGGQRDHNNTIHYVCLHCGKHWTQADLPPNLRIPMDKIGGPVG